MTTEACRSYIEAGVFPEGLDKQLDLGLGDEAAEGLALRTGNPHFTYDSYRRLIQMYGEVVDGIDSHRFEDALAALKHARGVSADVDLAADDLRDLVVVYKAIYREALGREFPQDARAQLRSALEAVFRSRLNPRARTYRRLNDIPETLGTAVNVVQMVLGNTGTESATGVAFSRDPATGEKVLCGEFLVDVQGEDVVAGVRAPQPIDELQRVQPMAYAALRAAMDELEHHYCDAAGCADSAACPESAR